MNKGKGNEGDNERKTCEQQEMGVYDFHECEDGEKFEDAISSANLTKSLFYRSCACAER